MKQKGTPVRLGERTVGFVIHGTFKKYIVGSKHLLNNPPAIGISVEAWEEAKRFGAEKLWVVDRESNKEYTATEEQFERYKFTQKRGKFEEQHFLALKYWSKYPKDEPEPELPKAEPKPARSMYATLSQVVMRYVRNMSVRISKEDASEIECKFKGYVKILIHAEWGRGQKFPDKELQLPASCMGYLVKGQTMFFMVSLDAMQAICVKCETLKDINTTGIKDGITYHPIPLDKCSFINLAPYHSYSHYGHVEGSVKSYGGEA